MICLTGTFVLIKINLFSPSRLESFHTRYSDHTPKPDTQLSLCLWRWTLRSVCLMTLLSLFSCTLIVRLLSWSMNYLKTPINFDSFTLPDWLILRCLSVLPLSSYFFLRSSFKKGTWRSCSCSKHESFWTSVRKHVVPTNSDWSPDCPTPFTTPHWQSFYYEER